MRLGTSSSFLSAFLSSSRTLHFSIRSCTAVGYFLLGSAFTLGRFSDAAQRTEPPDFSLLSMRGTDDPFAQKNQSQQHEPRRRTRSLSRTLKHRGASDSRHTVSGESLMSFYWAGRWVCERWRAGCLWNWMLEGFLHAALHRARARPVHDVSWGDQRVSDPERIWTGLALDCRCLTIWVTHARVCDLVSVHALLIVASLNADWSRFGVCVWGLMVFLYLWVNSQPKCLLVHEA